MRDTTMTGRFDSKVAFVMGCGNGEGIGSAASLMLAREGAKVVCCDVRGDAAEQLVAQIRAGGGEAVAAAADIADETAVRSAVMTAVEHYGGIDCLLSNPTVGDDYTKTLVEEPLELLDKCWEVNVRGFAVLLREIVPGMVSRGGGAIVYTSSACGGLGTWNVGAYGATKAAGDALCRHIATAYGKQAIRANAVAPGRCLTHARHSASDPAEQLVLRHHLTPRLGTSGDVAKMIVYLLSDDAAFITGQTINVDGGLQAHQPYSADEIRPDLVHVGNGERGLTRGS